MDRITFRVDPALKEQLEAQARAEGIRPSDLVRDALREHLKRRKPPESAYDLAERLGVIGSAKGLPPDLSTNPAHMEGFGRD
ncbi:ribbon-helix-helix domain-containing protein [Aquisphaera insulae]|uniref:ribbon-helix-helix domain-containing protein n=1 Tax=Aquisphaera insulae TaxID=2712864 RepID=UPI0013EB44D7|nr:ribbon-helix-helix domain-containing protein [Aquisphaera insulae]